MSKVESLTKKAIELIKAGKRQDASRILKAVLREDPTNQTAWNWYIETLPTTQERIEALEEFLLLMPENVQALRALGMLKRQEAIRRAAAATAGAQTASPEVPLPKTPTPSLPAPSETIVVSQTKKSANPVYTTIVALFSLLLLCLLIVYSYKLQVQHQALQAMNTELLGNYTRLQIAYEVSQQEKAQLKAQLDKLWLDYVTLNQAYNDLSLGYSDLESRLNGLSVNYASLDDQYKRLVKDYGNLETNFSNLKTEHSTLASDLETLRTNYTNLYGWYTWLQTNAVTPPYIAIHNRQVTLGFYAPDGSVQTWTKDVAQLEQAIIAGEQNRNNPSYIYLDVKGNQFTEQNYSPYVDPEPFKDYIPSLYHASGSDYDFIQGVRRIISQLTIYNTESYQLPQHPLETFLMGGGDSEDISILLASMLLAAPVDWEVRMVFMDIDHPQDAQNINHVIVYVDTGKEKYLLEPTDPDAFWSFDTQGWSLDVSK